MKEKTPLEPGVATDYQMDISQKKAFWSAFKRPSGRKNNT